MNIQDRIQGRLLLTQAQIRTGPPVSGKTAVNLLQLFGFQVAGFR
jgi:hypothetical protein